MTAPLPGPDGLTRCPWSVATPEYIAYHDAEWGQPVTGDDAMFERLALEGFQAGLSWLLILRRREALRAAFDGFAIERVAAYDDTDVSRLLAAPGMIRNHRKVRAAIVNARAAAALPDGLASLVAQFAPAQPAPAPRTTAEIPSRSPESEALARELRRRGFVFVGPTTMYALMQAVGLVNDHLAGCFTRGD